MRASRSPSILLARAVGLLRRVHALHAGATHPCTEMPLAEIDLEARNICTWLCESRARAGSIPDTLISIEQRLTSEAERLDEIEDLLRMHGVDMES
jgi:hypothetical protein